MITVCKTHNL